MAKINIEKKNRNTRLIWILVLFIILLLGIIWWLGSYEGEGTGGENRPVTEQTSLEKPMQRVVHLKASGIQQKQYSTDALS